MPSHCISAFCGSDVQAHVQKRFEEGGPNRQHLIGSLVRVQVTRGVGGQDAILDGMVNALARAAPTTRAALAPPIPARSAAVSADVDAVRSTSASVPAPVKGLALAAPPAPKVKRPMSSRTGMLPPPLSSPAPSDSDVFASLPTAGGAGDVDSVQPPAPKSPAPLENVTVGQSF